jgi:hypothetical protein
LRRYITVELVGWAPAGVTDCHFGTVAVHGREAGVVLRTGTRPTLCFDEPPRPRVCMSTVKVNHAPISVERLLSMTLL